MAPRIRARAARQVQALIQTLNHESVSEDDEKAFVENFSYQYTHSENAQYFDFRCPIVLEAAQKAIQRGRRVLRPRRSSRGAQEEQDEEESNNEAGENSDEGEGQDDAAGETDDEAEQQDDKVGANSDDVEEQDDEAGETNDEVEQDASENSPSPPPPSAPTSSPATPSPATPSSPMPTPPPPTPPPPSPPPPSSPPPLPPPSSPPTPSPLNPSLPARQPPHPYVEDEEEGEGAGYEDGEGDGGDGEGGNEAAEGALTMDSPLGYGATGNSAEREEDQQEEAETRSDKQMKANNTDLQGDISNSSVGSGNNRDNARPFGQTSPSDQGGASTTVANSSAPMREVLNLVGERQLRLSASVDEPSLRETIKEILSDPAFRKALEDSKNKASKSSGKAQKPNGKAKNSSNEAKKLSDKVKDLVILINSFFAPEAYLELKASIANILRYTNVSNIPGNYHSERVSGYGLAGKVFDSNSPDTLRALQERWNHARHMETLGDKHWHKVELMLARMELYLYWEQALRIYTSNDDKSAKDREYMEQFVDNSLGGRRRRRGGKRVDDLKLAITPYLGIRGEEDNNTWKYWIKVGSHVAVFNKLWGLLPLIRPTKLLDIGRPLLEAAIPLLLARHPSLVVTHRVIHWQYVSLLKDGASLSPSGLQFATSAPDDALAFENACYENPSGLVGLFGYRTLEDASVRVSPTTPTLTDHELSMTRSRTFEIENVRLSPMTPTLAHHEWPMTPSRSHGLPQTPPPTRSPRHTNPFVHTEALTDDRNRMEEGSTSDNDSDDDDVVSTVSLSSLQRPQYPANRERVRSRTQRDESSTPRDGSPSGNPKRQRTT
ncbi:MAG: hypothetical protein Q9225_007637 [Loekoesia sp. 1 TL-2023]